MKKFCCILLAVLLLTACGAKEPMPPSGTPGMILSAIYSAHSPMDLRLVGQSVNLTDAAALSYYAGLSSGEALRTLSASESAEGLAYSLVVGRVKDPADAESVARAMLEGVDAGKWIGARADTRVAGICGDVVMFFMVTGDLSATVTADSMAEAFQSVCSGTATILR